MDPADIQATMRFRGSFSGYERDRLFVQVGAPGRPAYVEAGAAWGLDLDHDGRAVAPLDFDGDGDLDLAILSLGKVSIHQNDGPARHFVRLSLRATAGHAAGLGAVVEVEAGGRRQVARLALTEGFHTQVLPELHFGLGEAQRADRVQVRWPSGHTQRFEALESGAHWRLVEGVAVAERRPLPAWPESTRPRPGGRYALSAPVEVDGLRTALGVPGRPLVVNFWATWCEACRTELPTLAKLETDVRLVSVDRKATPQAQRAFLRERGFDRPLVVATDELVERFFPGGRIELPQTFLFDAAGRLQRSFHRTLDGATLDAQLAALQTAAPTPADRLALARAAAQKGDHDTALRQIELAAKETPTAEILRELGAAALATGDLERAVDVLARATAAAPGDAEAWLSYGRALVKSSLPDEGRRALRRSLELDPRRGGAWNDLGSLEATLGDIDAAVAAWNQAVKHEPGYVMPYRNLARAHLGRGQREAAIDTLRRLLHQAPYLKTERGLLEKLEAGE